jgi:hypothetical protein
MAFGAGKYDEECNVARVMAQAKGALLIIIDGDRGEGFSAQIDARYIERIPAMLRTMADMIEADIAARKG